MFNDVFNVTLLLSYNINSKRFFYLADCAPFVIKISYAKDLILCSLNDRRWGTAIIIQQRLHPASLLIFCSKVYINLFIFFSGLVAVKFSRNPLLYFLYKKRKNVLQRPVFRIRNYFFRIHRELRRKPINYISGRIRLRSCRSNY